MLNYFKKLFDANAKEIQRLNRTVAEINSLEKKAKKLKPTDFPKETEKLKQEIDGKSENLEKHLPWSFAIVREAAFRVLGERHYDVQLIAAVALHEGKIAEQKTGEGKTLSATAPLYLNALVGKGAHLVTVNDYLARRDAGWMGMIYSYLGLSTAAIISDQSFIFDQDYFDKQALDWRLQHLRQITRKQAYDADITYGVNSEFGFDYLRDNMAFSSKQRSQRDFYYAIVDEVDSVLIDEARTPHIISAPYGENVKRYYRYAQIVDRLMSETDYVIDEKVKTANLTDRGIEKVEKILGVKNIYESDYDSLFHTEAALKARTLFSRDKDYIVRNNEVVIVDEFTGRLLEGRRFSEGIHQAIEAKEGVSIKQESKTLATVSLQNYFRMYKKLTGMTGTAATEAEEFHKIYKLEVITVPTNKPLIRVDNSDFIFKTERGKFTALAEEISKLNQVGRPVLVGTTNIDKNEILSSLLKKKGVKHEVLNAKNHEREAIIITNAGRKGSVTIATNMAGRGVDIILGGTPPSKYDKDLDNKSFKKQVNDWKKNHEEIIKLGGLYVIGTERHESRRIDNQLRGRSGRQGDPGETRFFISLEDDMLRIFGGDQIGRLMNLFKFPENQPIEHNMVSKAIEQAQVKVEGFNFDIRKNLLEFDDVLNTQREIIYGQRQKIINLAEQDKVGLVKFVDGQGETLLDEYLLPLQANKEQINEDSLGFLDNIFKISGSEKKKLAKLNLQELRKHLETNFGQILADKKNRFGNDLYSEGVKVIFLSTIDHYFTEHLTHIDNLREGISLRGYAQLDPLNEYKKESYGIFNTMLENIRNDFFRRLLHLEIQSDQLEQIEEQRDEGVAKHKEVAAIKTGEPHFTQESPIEDKSHTGPPTMRTPETKPVTTTAKIGRNDPCPCGAINPNTDKPYKYKKCGLINAPHHKG